MKTSSLNQIVSSDAEVVSQILTNIIMGYSGSVNDIAVIGTNEDQVSSIIAKILDTNELYDMGGIPHAETIQFPDDDGVSLNVVHFFASVEGAIDHPFGFDMVIIVNASHFATDRYTPEKGITTCLQSLEPSFSENQIVWIGTDRPLQLGSTLYIS